MAEQSTYIKLDRNILRWRWWGNSKVLHVFLFLLLNANIEDHEFENDLIKRGEVVTSLASIEKSTGLTTSQIRNTISTLKKTGEITSRFTNRYRVITIVNYDKYQENRQAKRQSNEQSTDRQATIKRQQLKNIKNDKNGKKEKNKEKKPSPSPLDGVGDVPKAVKLKPIGEGTVDDIPEEFRDFCKTYEEYWGFRNR